MDQSPIPVLTDMIVNVASEMASYLISKEVKSVTLLYVFARLMSQLADVNTQSTVGTFHFYCGARHGLGRTWSPKWFFTF